VYGRCCEINEKGKAPLKLGEIVGVETEMLLKLEKLLKTELGN
jgi:hypothetical protein